MTGAWLDVSSICVSSNIHLILAKLSLLPYAVLIWEISGDMVETDSGQIATPLIDATNAKIQNPNYDCSKLRDPLWALKDTTLNLAPPEPAEVDWSGYVAPSGPGGSANDFNGAVESTVSIPAPSPSGNVSPSSNAVYDPAVPVLGTDTSGGDGDGDDCPPSLTGYFPLPGCEQYVYCQGGSMVGAPLPCVPGTLFDVNSNTCNYSSNVSC